MGFLDWRSAIPKPKKEDKVEFEAKTSKEFNKFRRVKITFDLVTEYAEGCDLIKTLRNCNVFISTPESLKIIEMYYNNISLEEEIDKDTNLVKEDRNV